MINLLRGADEEAPLLEVKPEMAKHLCTYNPPYPTFGATLGIYYMTTISSFTMNLEVDEFGMNSFSTSVDWGRISRTYVFGTNKRVEVWL